MNLPSSESHKTSLMICQCWFRQWLGAIRQQVTTWANVDIDLCRHMASQGHNKSNYCEYSYRVVDIGRVIPDSASLAGCDTAAIRYSIVDIRVAHQPCTVTPVHERPGTTALELKHKLWVLCWAITQIVFARYIQRVVLHIDTIISLRSIIVHQY